MITVAYGYYMKNRVGRKIYDRTQRRKSRWQIFTSLAMTAGVLVYPFGTGEAEVARKDGVTTAIEHNGNLYNISPEKVVDNTFAYNRFKEFNLSQGQIANLLFGNSSTLANLVNGKINIAGIVNGVKDGKIDGHLIFLSPQGYCRQCNRCNQRRTIYRHCPDKNGF